MTAGYDWIFYASAAVLGLLGLWLLYRSLFRDRSRGRRRCSKCWYDLGGTPESLTCSECGRCAKSESQLRKTRRRWRWAFVATCICILGGAVAVTPKTYREGWHSVAPTSVLTLVLHNLQIRDSNADLELERRMDQGTLWRWQWSWLLRTSVRGGLVPWSLTLSSTRGKLPAETVHASIDFARGRTGKAWIDNANLRACLRAVGDRTASPVIVPIDRAIVLPALNAPGDSHCMPPLNIVGGSRIFELDVEIQREVVTRVPSPATARRTPSMILGATNGPWTTIAVERHSFVVQANEQSAVPRHRTDPELTEIVRQRVWFQLTNSTLDVFQTFDFPRECATIACPVRIELLLNDVSVLAYTDWWDLDPSNSAAQGQFFPLPGRLRMPQGTTRYETDWKVHVRGEPGLALWANSASECWAGEFTLTMHTSKTADGVTAFSTANTSRGR